MSCKQLSSRIMRCYKFKHSIIKHGRSSSTWSGCNELTPFLAQSRSCSCICFWKWSNVFLESNERVMYFSGYLLIWRLFHCFYARSKCGQLCFDFRNIWDKLLLYRFTVMTTFTPKRWLQCQMKALWFTIIHTVSRSTDLSSNSSSFLRNLSNRLFNRRLCTSSFKEATRLSSIWRASRNSFRSSTSYSNEYRFNNCQIYLCLCDILLPISFRIFQFGLLSFDFLKRIQS